VRRTTRPLTRPRALVLAAIATVTALTSTPTEVRAQATQPVFVELTGPGIAVNGTYTPIVGNFSGNNGLDDILWYAPGPGVETLWEATSVATAPFTKLPVTQVNGTSTPIVGDFSNDGLEDILWYGPGSAPDTLWNFTYGGLVQRRLSISGTFAPIVLPNAGRPDSILWYAAGTATDWLWVFPNGAATHTSAPYAINGTYRPIAGDFGDDGLGDVFWYAPGSAPDARWTRTKADAPGSFASSPETVSGTYLPVVGDWGSPSATFADATSDIAWTTTTGADQTWERSGASWSKLTVAIGDQHLVRVGREGTDLLVTWGGPAVDHLWTPTPTGAGSNRSTDLPKIPADARPIVGRFAPFDHDAILWYRPGSGAERYWSPFED
jgi:hypothetical protein